MLFTAEWINMNFNRFYISVLIRFLLILLNLAIIAWLMQFDDRLFSLTIAGIAALIQVMWLFWFLTKANSEIYHFAESLKQSDYTVNYKARNNSYFKQLDEAFHSITAILKESRIKKEAHYQYLLHMLEEVNTGIIAISQTGEVDFMNKASRIILRMPVVKKLNKLQRAYPGLCDFMLGLREGNTQKYELITVEGKRILSIRYNKVLILGETKRIYSFHDIKGELEESEYEAWNKIIRMLSHEILNSITPMVSLAETGAELIETNKNELSEKQWIKIHDVFKTIEKRGQGLHQFVEGFRQFTRVPDPVLARISLNMILNNCLQMFKKQMLELNVKLHMFTSDIFILADANLMEQVIINILKNSIDAMADTNIDSRIQITDRKEIDTLYVIIEDNGIGIPHEKQNLVFIPFFSTKDKGSGIGLSLSKQIMQKHGGDLQIESEPGKYTRAILVFPNNDLDNSFVG